MKKQPARQHERLPVFSSEADEATWWHANRDLHGRRLIDAVKNGEARVLTEERLRERIEASRRAAAPSISLRIPEADLVLARSQAKRKGLPYQTYIKSLLHETLTARGKRKTGW